MKNFSYYTINHYCLYIEAYNNIIVRVSIADDSKLDNSCCEIEKFKVQLDEYFSGERKIFDVNFTIEALPFRQRLYNCINRIEYGNVVQAKTLMTDLGLKKGVNVILRATFANPLLIIIPCHRVVNPIRRISAYSYPKSFRDFLLMLERECYDEGQ